MFAFYSGDYTIYIPYVGKMHSFAFEIYGAYSYHVPIKNFSPLEVLGTACNKGICSEMGEIWTVEESSVYSVVVLCVEYVVMYCFM